MSLKLCEEQTLLNKDTLLADLAEVLAFPDYFGHNWDAAWDALTELSFADGPIALELDLSHKMIEQADLEVFIELLEEATEYWQEQNQSFNLRVLR